MATQTFDIDGSNGTSTAVSVGTGESLRVRFTTFTGGASAKLKIDANSTVTYVDIDDEQAWATGAVISGDSCSVVVDLFGDANGQVAGIIETF